MGRALRLGQARGPRAAATCLGRPTKNAHPTNEQHAHPTYEKCPSDLRKMLILPTQNAHPTYAKCPSVGRMGSRGDGRRSKNTPSFLWRERALIKYKLDINVYNFKHSGKNMEIIRINQTKTSHYWSGKGFNGTVVNRALCLQSL